MSELALPNVGSEPARLKIALLGYRSNPYSGGQGIYLRYLSKALAEAGHSVDVISGEPYPELDHPGVRLVALPGLNLSAAQDRRTALKPRHLLSATDTFEWLSTATGGFPEPYTFGQRVARYLARHGHEYQIIHDNQSLSSGVLGLQQRGFPVVTTVHRPITWDRDIALRHAESAGHRLLIRRRYNFLKMQRRVARRLDHLVTVSAASKRDISAEFGIDPGRIHVIRNGIDTRAFRPEPSIARNPWQLITTASADQPLKGTQYLIPAFAALLRRYPKLRLVFIGKPRPGGATERLIAHHQVGERIRFVHGISADDIRYLYASSAIAVVPSEYEGFGLPAGEAMACGVPLVSTDGGALREVVADAGLIVPTRDSRALERAIADLLESPVLRARYAERGRARIHQEFSWSRAAEEMTLLYRRVLSTIASGIAQATFTTPKITKNTGTSSRPT